MAAIHVYGAPTAGQKVFKYVSPFTRRTTVFQAEVGLVTVITEEAGGGESYDRVPRAEFTARALVISAMARKEKYPRARKALDDLAMCMVHASRAAREQGDPFESPAAARQVVERHRRVRVAPGYRYDPGVPHTPRARPDAPLADLAGTTVVAPSRLIIPGR